MLYIPSTQSSMLSMHTTALFLTKNNKQTPYYSSVESDSFALVASNAVLAVWTSVSNSSVL